MIICIDMQISIILFSKSQKIRKFVPVVLSLKYFELRYCLSNTVNTFLKENDLR